MTNHAAVLRELNSHKNSTVQKKEKLCKLFKTCPTLTLGIYTWFFARKFTFLRPNDMIVALVVNIRLNNLQSSPFEKFIWIQSRLQFVLHICLQVWHYKQNLKMICVKKEVKRIWQIIKRIPTHTHGHELRKSISHSFFRLFIVENIYITPQPKKGDFYSIAFATQYCFTFTFLRLTNLSDAFI